MTTATGVGSWPGTSAREAVRAVRDILSADDLPYLPETPERGPGADLVGRGAGLLVELPVDLQPMGWRFVARPGRDAERAAALLTEDLDELAEAYDGYTGALKLQVCGPWSLAASIWLTRGERALTDPGARRDLVSSLGAGVIGLLARVRSLVPGAELVLQLDEPSLPAVLGGWLPTASGFGKVAAVDPQEVRAGLREVVAAAGSTPTVLHCCADDPPVPVLRDVGATGLSLDTSSLKARTWEGVAVGVESGLTLYAGTVPVDEASPSAADLAQALERRWADLGLDPTSLDAVVVSPSCGLAVGTVAEAVRRQKLAVEVALRLGDIAARA